MLGIGGPNNHPIDKKNAFRPQIRHYGFRPKNPVLEKENGMQIKSILNRVQLHSGFVYGSIRLVEKAARQFLEIEIRPRKSSRPVCSGCGLRGPGYDTLQVRRFEFVPLWNIPVFFLYRMRRVICPRCGVKVEKVPWAEGKNHLTTTYAWFLATWAKRLSWKQVSEAFQTTWDNVFRAVKMAVAYGLANRDLENVTALGIDEISAMLQIDIYFSHCISALWNELFLFFIWMHRRNIPVAPRRRQPPWSIRTGPTTIVQDQNEYIVENWMRWAVPSAPFAFSR